MTQQDTVTDAVPHAADAMPTDLNLAARPALLGQAASEALSGLGGVVPEMGDTSAAEDAYRVLSLLASRALTLRDELIPLVPEADREPVPQLDAVHTERARLAAFLAAAVPSVLSNNDGRDDRTVLTTTSPEGQITYHIKREDLVMFGHVPHVADDDPRAQWDGHSTPEKNARLEALTGLWARYGGNPSHVSAPFGD